MLRDPFPQRSAHTSPTSCPQIYPQVLGKSSPWLFRPACRIISRKEPPTYRLDARKAAEMQVVTKGLAKSENHSDVLLILD